MGFRERLRQELLGGSEELPDDCYTTAEVTRETSKEVLGGVLGATERRHRDVVVE